MSGGRVGNATYRTIGVGYKLGGGDKTFASDLGIAVVSCGIAYDRQSVVGCEIVEMLIATKVQGELRAVSLRHRALHATLGRKSVDNRELTINN